MPRAPKPGLDLAFFALSDPTRRRILEQLGAREAAVTELAEPHVMSLPAISKHLRVLEEAGLITRRIEGRQHFLRANPDPLQQAKQWIEHQSVFWEGSFDRLDAHLTRITQQTKNKSKPRKP